MLTCVNFLEQSKTNFLLIIHETICVIITVSKPSSFRWNRLRLFSFVQRIKERRNLQNVINNTVWLVADRLLRMGVGLFVGIWIARYLGVKQFGIFSYASAFVSLFVSVSTLGLQSLVIRTLTEEKEEKNRVLGTTFYLQLLGGILTLILSIFIISILEVNNQLMVNMVTVLGAVSIFQSFDTIDLWFQYEIKSKYPVFARNIAFAISSVVKIILINFHAPLIAFAWAVLGEVIIGKIGLIFFYKLNRHSIWMWRWSSSLAKKLLRESWPLILSGITIMIYMKIDQIMLGNMMGDKAAGLYSAAVRVSEVFYFIPTAITTSIAPSIYLSQNNDSEFVFTKKMSQLLRLLCFGAFLIILPMSFFSNQIILLLFGSQFHSAGIILAVHIWAALFVFMGVGTSLWFISQGLNHISFIMTLIGATLNVILNFILIPHYSGLGAAIATVVAYAIAAFLGNAILPKTRKIFFLQLKSLLFFLD